MKDHKTNRYTIILLLLLNVLVACSSKSNVEPTEIAQIVQIEETTSESSEINNNTDSPEVRGAELFTQMIEEVGFSCASCHHLTDARLIGPGMGSIEERYANYDAEDPLREFILASIRQPQEFIFEEDPAFPENVMPVYDDILSEDQLNDLADYILSL